MCNDSILSAEEKAAVDRFWEDWHSRRARSRATNREFVQGHAYDFNGAEVRPAKGKVEPTTGARVREILKSIASFRPASTGDGVELQYHGDDWQHLRDEYEFLQGLIEQEIGKPVGRPTVYAQARALAS